MKGDSTLAMEKPQNGIAGLKHWRHDLLAGMVVSLVSLPFSLGIAVASGAPPVCGLISAIIAGLILPFLGGSYVTISGPAAGLAPALFAGMILLGNGDRAVGYPLLLVAICMTGVVQIILARFKLARFAAIFPASVVEGMLAAIGLLIIAKQLPLILGSPGNKFEAREFWGIVRETPSQFMHLDPKVFCLGMFCLALIFALASIKSPTGQDRAATGDRSSSRSRPGVVSAELSRDRLIFIPEHPFRNGFQWPHFSEAFSNHTLWWGLFTTILTLTLIDGVESLATIAAIDKIDPFRRKSDPNRTLYAMGVSNLCSSLAGGLTIIPGGVKSKTGILTGARTQWANFYNACFLIVYLLLGRNLINLMPMTVLGAIVLFTGFKLCAPKVWKHIAHIGSEQLFVFATTVLVTITTDLLWGIAAGIVAKLLVELAIVSRVERRQPQKLVFAGLPVKRWVSKTGELFRDPVLKTMSVGETYHMYFGRPMVCFNSLHIDRQLSLIPGGASAVCMHVTDLVTLIDHTTATLLLDFVENFKRAGRGVVTITGLDKLRARSHAEAAMRVSAPVWAQERAEALTALARINLTHIEPEAPDPLVMLERFSLTHVGPIPVQEEHLVNEFIVVRVAKSVTRMTRSVRDWVRTALVHGEAFPASRRNGQTGVPPGELDKPSLSSSEYNLPAWDPSKSPAAGEENAWSASFPPTSLD